MASAYVTLMQIRARLKASITKTHTFAHQSLENVTYEQVVTHAERLEQTFETFTRNTDCVVAHSEVDGYIDPNADFDAYEDKYLAARSLLRGLEVSLRPPAETTDQSSSMALLAEQQVSVLQQVSSANLSGAASDLPKINIPTFSGDYSEWPSFSDMFSTSVGTRARLSSTQKLYHLKSVLRGDAAELIRHIPITENSFETAWARLKERYDRPRQIINSFIDRFVSLPAASKEEASMLRQVSDGANAVLRGLTSIGYEDRDCWLIYILLKKLDSSTGRRWIHESRSVVRPTIASFLEFLDSRCEELELGAASTAETSDHRSARGKAAKTFVTVQRDSIRCYMCNGSDHILRKCASFLELSVKDRRRKVRDKALCFNCLQPGHSVSECRSKFTCRECHQRHHTLVHDPVERSGATTASTLTSSNAHQDSRPAQAALAVSAVASVAVSLPASTFRTTSHFAPMLPTALVDIVDAQGHTVTCRALLDCASELSYISEQCIQRLRISRAHSRIAVTGIASAAADHTRGCCQAQIRSRTNSFRLTACLHILKHITAAIPSGPVANSLPHSLQGLALADPTFNVTAPIDILIGGQYVWDVFTAEKHVDAVGNVIAVSSQFGWVVTQATLPPATTSCAFLTLVDIDASIRRLWELDDIPHTAVDADATFVEQQFATTHTRAPDGRYVVHLPFKDTNARFADTLSGALSRLYSLERRFKKDKRLCEQYTAFMREYAHLGHMRQLTPEELLTSNDEVFYLPHHPVVGKKLRVVFDGSYKGENICSLNDRLHVGPNLQRDLFSVCLRFRFHRFAFSADVVKMFRQIWVTESHRNFQRIVWRESHAHPVQHFQLCTVTYGTSCAPFLAVRILKQLADDYSAEFPRASRIVAEDFYVDDVLSGANTESEVKQLQHELIHLFSRAGMELSKWVSNTACINADGTKQPMEVPLQEESKAPKVLGLHWKPDTDCLSYQVRTGCGDITKRHILSEISGVFDPLGLLAPVVTRLKIFFQELWLTELGWDDRLPAHLSQWWMACRDDMHCIRQISIPRFVPINDDIIELHGFCDASTKAYAAAVYARKVTHTGKAVISLMASRTRVAPLKPVSVPRLELCGALLLARLIQRIQSISLRKPLKVHAWTDSTVVLAWLSHSPTKMKTFVANRTFEIGEVLPRHVWNYVASGENPADCASRGLRASELLTYDLWWKGPVWLRDERLLTYQLNKSVNPNLVSANNVDAEFKQTAASLVTTIDERSEILNRLLNRLSSWRIAVRVVAYVKHFIIKCRRLTPLGLADECIWARALLLQYGQLEFQHEISALNSNRELSRRSRLKRLHPFIDQFGVMRVGGRIRHSELPFSSRHPILLPKSSRVTHLILHDEHIRNLHPGVSALFVIVRQRYWILGARNLIRKLTHTCIRCFRQRQVTTEQLMADLPTYRVRQAYPFEKTGCDYAGPLNLKLYPGRNTRTTKGYICLFVCMVTSAVHVELVTDLTTEAFLASLRRFMARRGKCSQLFSDNGKTFVGAARALNPVVQLITSQSHNDMVTKSLADDGIRWTFIPPNAPHWGGIWESAVRSMKLHLRRVIGETILTVEQMRTLLVQVEAVVNSRPLGTASDTQLGYLSPAHFLIGRPLTLLPEDDLLEVPKNRLGYWQNVQAMMHGFWRQWHHEYLTGLQQRPKWDNRKPNIEVDTVVVIKDPNSRPGKWCLGRVSEAHIGKDGLTRAATVKTAHGTMTRPISRLVVLPIS